jgi:hypothetical protein
MRFVGDVVVDLLVPLLALSDASYLLDRAIASHGSFSGCHVAEKHENMLPKKSMLDI